MRVCTEVGVVFFLLFNFGLSAQSSCWKQQYGNCDPGASCKNWDNSGEHKNLCFDCGNGGYITWDKVGDGIVDCTNGADEYVGLSDSALLKSVHRPNCAFKLCSVDYECCSWMCKDGTCWDDFHR